MGTRSRLYRATMRAQLAVAVVNESLPGGWLEFLGRGVEPDAGGFDTKAERLKRVETAADDVVVAATAEANTKAQETSENKGGSKKKKVPTPFPPQPLRSPR